MANNRNPAGPSASKFYLEGNTLIDNAISNLAVEIHAYNKKYGKKSVLFTGCGAANGTPMIAINLAITLSNLGKTLLVDANLRRGSAMEDGLCDYFRKNTDISKVIRPTNIPELYFAPSGAPVINPAIYLCSDKMEEFVKLVNSKYDHVIIDCPPVIASPDAAAMFIIVDGVVLVCSLNKTSKKQIKRAKDAVAPYADKYYGMVVNSMGEEQYKKLVLWRSYNRRNKKV